MGNGRQMDQSKNWFSGFFSVGLVLGLLVLPLVLGSCSKKKDANVGYDSEREGAEGRSAKEGGYGESDLGEGGTGGSKGSIAGIETVYFDYDSASLSQDARNGLQENAKQLKSQKSLNITVEGHCDERGSTEYNLALGERRANAVRDYLVSLGVSQNRLRIISYGEERPAIKGSSESTWSKNRRAEFANR